MTGPAAARLPDGRLHFQHGPIDLIVEAFGPEPEVTAAYRQAWSAFRPVLDGLVAVLPLLRSPVTELMFTSAARRPGHAEAPPPVRRMAPGPRGGREKRARPGGADRARSGTDAQDEERLTSRGSSTGIAPGEHTLDVPTSPPGDPLSILHVQVIRPQSGSLTSPHLVNPPDISPVAAAMIRAAAEHGPAFVTPMAAVAGAVADHVLAAMTAGRRLDRAYVNNGGDAALWLSPGAALTAAGGPGLADRVRVTADGPVRGIATSGWRGRSHSLGIADAVTVLARSAAEADVAATLVANAVDLPGHGAIARRPARELAPDSDLGDRLVTVEVGPLTESEIARALAAGRTAAERMLGHGLIEGAALWLGGRCETTGPCPWILPPG